MDNYEYVNISYDNKIVPLCIYNKDEYLSNFIRRYERFYEIWILEYIKKNHYKNKNIIDVGANIGNHVKFFANFLDFDCVYAFEPQSDNYELLKKNTQEKCMVWNCAIGDSACKCSLSVPNEENCGLYGIADINSNSTNINMYTIDDFNFEHISLMKIDVEGYEYQVILGAIRTIIKWKPVIFVETNDVRVDEILNSLGYIPKRRFFEGDTELGTLPTIEFICREAGV